MREHPKRRRGALRPALVLGTLLSIGLGAGHAQAQSSQAAQDFKDCKELVEENKLARAAGRCDAAIKADPRGLGIDVYVSRAAIFYGLQQYEAGLKWLDGVALARFPGAPALLEHKALLLAKLPGKSAEAIAIAEEAVKKDAKLFLSQRMLCEHFSSTKFRGAKAKDAIASCSAYLAERPSEGAKTDGKYLVFLGFAQLSTSQFEDAQDRFEKALAIRREGSVAANARKGQCAALTGLGLTKDRKLFDKAITVCEDVLKKKQALGAGGASDPSPYYNLGVAYLERKQFDKALENANSYIGKQPSKPNGFLLRGKIYFEKKQHDRAEAEFSRAYEKDPTNAEVTRWRGRNYLANNQPERAVKFFEDALKRRSDDLVAFEGLAEAYLRSKRPKDAATMADRALKLPGQENSPSLLALAGEGYYRSGELKEARERFARAYEVKPDAKTQGQLIDTIVSQSKERLDKNDEDGATKLLAEAYARDASSIVVNFNLGVLALDAGKSQEALKYLQVAFAKRPNDVVVHRLMGKVYLQLGDNAKAGEHFSKAEEEALRLRNNLLLAEIYTDWAPLLVAQSAEQAVTKLEDAERASSGQAWLKATQRNLQIAYFKRGYDRWRAGRSGDALSDLEGAVRYPANLTKDEEEAFAFALGLAALSAGRAERALGIFQRFGKQDLLPFLKAPWDKFGADFFLAYAWYREGSIASRRQAATAFERMVGKAPGAIGVKAKALLRSSWEFIAFDAFSRGDAKSAGAALAKADQFATGTEKRLIDHNRAVLGGGKSAEVALAGLGDSPPEALVNLGILRDQAGDAKSAFDLWVSAKSKGAQVPKLDEWIATKKRIYNF